MEQPIVVKYKWDTTIGSIGMNPIYRLVSESEMSAAEAIDWWAVAWCGKTQTEWAEERGVIQQAVSKNVSGALDVLEDNPEAAHRAVCDRLETFVSGEFAGADGKEGVYEIASIPNDLGEFEEQLLERFAPSEISLLVLADYRDGAIDSVHIRIADVV